MATAAELNRAREEKQRFAEFMAHNRERYLSSQSTPALPDLAGARAAVHTQEGGYDEDPEDGASQDDFVATDPKPPPKQPPKRTRKPAAPVDPNNLTPAQKAAATRKANRAAKAAATAAEAGPAADAAPSPQAAAPAAPAQAAAAAAAPEPMAVDPPAAAPAKRPRKPAAGGAAKRKPAAGGSQAGDHSLVAEVHKAIAVGDNWPLETADDVRAAVQAVIAISAPQRGEDGGGPHSGSGKGGGGSGGSGGGGSAVGLMTFPLADTFPITDVWERLQALFPNGFVVRFEQQARAGAGPSKTETGGAFDVHMLGLTKPDADAVFASAGGALHPDQPVRPTGKAAAGGGWHAMMSGSAVVPNFCVPMFYRAHQRGDVSGAVADVPEGASLDKTAAHYAKHGGVPLLASLQNLPLMRAMMGPAGGHASAAGPSGGEAGGAGSGGSSERAGSPFMGMGSDRATAPGPLAKQAAAAAAAAAAAMAASTKANGAKPAAPGRAKAKTANGAAASKPRAASASASSRGSTGGRRSATPKRPRVAGKQVAAVAANQEEALADEQAAGVVAAYEETDEMLARLHSAVNSQGESSLQPSPSDDGSDAPGFP